MQESLPEHVRRLIRQHLPTMAHVDVLLSLLKAGSDPVSAAELARAAHMNADGCESYLNALLLAGLATAEGSGASRRFLFAPLSPADAQTARDLAELMNRRPVALVRYVYEPQDEPPETLG